MIRNLLGNEVLGGFDQRFIFFPSAGAAFAAIFLVKGKINVWHPG